MDIVINMLLIHQDGLHLTFSDKYNSIVGTLVTIFDGRSTQVSSDIDNGKYVFDCETDKCKY